MHHIRSAMLLALATSALSTANATSVVLYANDFENPNPGALTVNCGNSLDSNTINFLYSQPGFVYNQTFTVEGLVINDPGGLYSNPEGVGGNYSIGMLSTAQNDLLAVTFDSQGLPFMNVGFDLSAIDVQGCGGPFGVAVPVIRVSLLDSPGGAFSFAQPMLDFVDLTGERAPGLNNFTFDWTRVVAELDATGSTDGNVSIVFDLLQSGYATFDNLSIVASDGAGIVDTDVDGVADDTDNCVFDQNPDQFDGDVDNVGLVCDPDDNDPNVCGDQDGDGLDDCASLEDQLAMWANAAYGSTVISDTAPKARQRPATWATKLAELDAAVTAGGCSIDGYLAGAYNFPQRAFSGTWSGGDVTNGVIGNNNTHTATLDPTYTLGDTFSLRNPEGQHVASRSPGDFEAGLWVKVTHKKGVFYGVTGTCTPGTSPATALAPWFNGSLAGWPQ